jgi:hypothetical protein
MGFNVCEHESAHLSLFFCSSFAIVFSSFTHTHVRFCSFRLTVLKTCLNKLPFTHLTQLYFKRTTIWPDDFDIDLTLISLRILLLLLLLVLIFPFPRIGNLKIVFLKSKVDSVLFLSLRNSCSLFSFH